MPSLTLTLSHPQSVARFKAAAEALLCQQGHWDQETESKLRQSANDLGLHPLDVPGITTKVRGLDSVQTAFAEEARKRPHEKWFELVAVTPTRLAIIIDSSDSSWDYANLITEYARALELAVQPVGTVQFWAWDQPTTSCALALNRKRGNASLFAPVWEKLKPELVTGTITHAVVLGAGRLFDIEDFAREPLIELIKFVPLDDTLTADTLPEHRLEPAELLASMMPNNASCSIGSQSAIPLWWDDPAWFWNGKELEFRQNEADFATPCGLRSAWLCGGGEIPSVESNIDTVSLQIHSASVPFSNQLRWQDIHYRADSLPESATEFRIWHSDDADAQKLLPSELEPEQKGWLWLSFSEAPPSTGRYDVQVCFHPTGAVVLQEGVEVALSQTDGIYVYRFRSDRWESKRISHSYLKVKENLYAFAL